MSEQYLITGSEGFIGRHLRKELAKKVGRSNIISVDMRVPSDDLIYRNDDTRKWEQVSFPNKVSDFFSRSTDEQYKFDFKVIYHLAAMSSPVEVERFPLEGIETNLIDSAMILDYARKQQDSLNHRIQLVFASSSAVSGRSLYGWTKKATEEISEYYRKNYPMNVANCRFFNTFGNDEFKGNYTSMPTQFLDKAMKDEPILIYGNGKQSRDFIYIKDLVEWLMEVGSVKSGIFDFGTGISTSYNELANMVIRITNSKSKIKYVNNPLKSYQKYTKANMPFSKPKYTLEEGLKDMIEERKHQLKPLGEDAQ